MFAIELHFLTGRAVATSPQGYGAAEWPPHPARLFFALVSTCYETGGDPPDPEEEAALLWLETQAPPALRVSEARHRDVVDHYVPVNDTKPGDKDKKHGDRPLILPECRPPQKRQFPTVCPDDPMVTFIWREADPSPRERRALASLCGRLAYLGHSSSLVAARLLEDPPAPNWIPDRAGRERLRVTAEGQLRELRAAFARACKTKVRGPLPAIWASYRIVDGGEARVATPHRSIFGEVVVFARRGGPSLPIEATVAVTRTLRGAILAHAEDPRDEVLSGHRADSRATDRTHVAFVALPFVGHRHADGRLMGAGVVLPRAIDPEGRKKILRAVGRFSATSEAARLTLGRLGAWILERISGYPLQVSLRPSAWARASRVWASATPIVLDRFPRRILSPESEEIIASAVERIGLPSPERVCVGGVPWLAGAAPAPSFPPYRSRNGAQYVHVHARIEFREAVEGFVLLGRGRYFGMGLCRPLREEDGGREA